jgi:putative hydrolase of the HAD superfamily
MTTTKPDDAPLHNGPIELVLVDFDDTLVDTAPRFQQARRGLIALLEEAGFEHEAARHMLYERVDPGMRAEYGLGPRRMEPAFAATYRRLCEERGEEPDAALLERCAALGRACYGTPTAFTGALAALRRLSRRYPTVVYTQSGDMEYQLSCIRGAGIIDIVAEDRVRIADRKDAVAFRETLEWYGVTEPAAAWMIGNSMRADINPALEAGANAILVDSADPWEYDLVAPVSERFHRADSFAAAVELLVALP